ncbi:MAG: glycosyltransferase family 4 protein [Anaerolineales bacterium]|nr:glycosyltransferase family 4 protein [Anaerolineales bacterium]
MRVCLTPRVGGGGPASFQTRLQAEFGRLGVETTFDPRERPLDAVLVFAGTKDLPALARCRMDRVRVVQRLDGINWLYRVSPRSPLHTLRSVLWNWQLRLIRARFAEGIVYQSGFARELWERRFGKAAAAARVIHNGVALSEYPAERHSHDGTLLAAEANLDFHAPARGILRAAQRQFIQTRTLSRLSVYTRSTPEWEGEWARFDPPPETPGMRPRAEVQARQKTAALFLTLDLNPSCPNAVIESLAAGLPVVGFDTGSVGELVGDGGEAVKYEGDPWKLEVPRNLDAIGDAGRRVLDNWQDYSRRARGIAEQKFDIRRIAQSYLEALSG